MVTFTGIATYLALSNSLCRATQPLVHTPLATYKGTCINSAVDAFLGVPFAQPPVGPLRFAPPQVVRPEPKKIVDASAFGPVCHQFHFRTVLGENLIEKTGQSEDCLTLNIFAPKERREKKLLPVYVWSYGGAFGEGGGSVPLFNPADFVEHNKDIIVVTWNYRLNIFGFPAAPNQPANLGLRDQRFALEWLRANLGAFGGDASRIVLGGQSAGADSGAAMMYTHPDDPIAAGLILQSGAPEYIGEADGSEWGRVAGLVGCGVADLDCMRRVPAEALSRAAAVTNQTFHAFGSPSGGSPIVDNVTHFSVQDYLRRGAEGRFAKVPTLMGITNDEGDGVTNWSPTRGVNESLANAITITYFNCPMAAEASFRAMHDVPTWRYRYMGVFPSVTPYSWLGAYHQADVPIVFGSFPSTANASSPPPLPYETAASHYLQAAFAAFIRNPERGLELEMGWPRYNASASTLVELFANNSTNATFADPAKCDRICANPPPVCLECYLDQPTRR